MPSVGGISFDGILGGVYAPLSTSQLDSYLAAMVAFRIGREPTTAQGKITVFADLDQATALTRIAQTQRLVGTEVTVDYGSGATVVGATVASVAPTWKPVLGDTNRGVLEIAIAFDQSASTDGQDQQTIATVQTATTFGTWSTQSSLKCYEATDGLATYAGEAEAESVGVAPLDIIGQWVRITVAGVPDWHGVCTSRFAAGEKGNKTRIRYTFLGLAAALDKVAFTQWYEWTTEAEYSWLVGLDILSDPGDVLPFNGRISGDSTTAAKALPNATTAYLPDRGAPGTQFDGNRMVDTLLKIAKQLWPNGPTWALAGQTTLLANLKRTVNCHGMSMLQAIASVASVDNGLTFSLDVSGTTVTINVSSIDVDNQYAAPIDLTVSDILNWNTGLDGTETLDRFYAAANNPWYMSTFNFKANNSGLFAKGWDFQGVAETNWASRVGPLKDAPDTAMVWRRFIIKPTWIGGTDKNMGTSLPWLRHVNATLEEDGSLDAGGVQPNARMGFKFQRMLPIGRGRDWSVAYTRVQGGAELEQPLVYAVNGTTWTPIHTIMPIQVGDDQASIICGKDWQDGVYLKGLFDLGYRLVFTLSWTHPMPWRMSWSRKAAGVATAPRDLPRSAVKYFNDEALQQIVILNDTVVGLSTATPPAPLYADANAGPPTRVDGNDVNGLLKILNREVAFVGADLGSCAWIRKNRTTLTPAPGSVVTVATIPITSSTTATETLNALVSRRVKRYVRGDVQMHWQATRQIGSTVDLSHAGPHVDLSHPATLGRYSVQ